MRMGCSESGGRKEVFEIADDEQLFGCEFEYEEQGYDTYFYNMKWLKWKINA